MVGGEAFWSDLSNARRCSASTRVSLRTVCGFVGVSVMCLYISSWTLRSSMNLQHKHVSHVPMFHIELLKSLLKR